MKQHFFSFYLLLILSQFVIQSSTQLNKISFLFDEDELVDYNIPRNGNHLYTTAQFFVSKHYGSSFTSTCQERDGNECTMIEDNNVKYDGSDGSTANVVSHVCIEMARILLADIRLTLMELIGNDAPPLVSQGNILDAIEYAVVINFLYMLQ